MYKYINPISKPIIPKIIQSTSISTFFSPKQKRTLFWCIYIASMYYLYKKDKEY